jgi:hypothetical protein
MNIILDSFKYYRYSRVEFILLILMDLYLEMNLKYGILGLIFIYYIIIKL